jgi:hypothetical protein
MKGKVSENFFDFIRSASIAQDPPASMNYGANPSLKKKRLSRLAKIAGLLKKY